MRIHGESAPWKIPYELDEEQLMERYPQYQKGWNFSWSFSYGDEVFFLGVCPLLMCLHTRSNQVSYITNWPDIWEDSGNSFVINSCCQMEGQLAIGGTSSVIVCFDMASKRFSTKTATIHRVYKQKHSTCPHNGAPQPGSCCKRQLLLS